MAKPRVFISSTYYDLKYIRTDLERFITDLGYEPVNHQKGQIPYGKQEALEKYCYREIQNCEILVHIIGSKFGTLSNEGPYSISQVELKTAHELNRQIYIFVERNVLTEYRTYLANENNDHFIPQYVDNINIYKFLKEVYNYTTNNSISEFDNVTDIMNYLCEQWAGLFQRFLQEDSRLEDYRISTNLKTTADTLAKIIKYMTTQKDETIKRILIYNHPVFVQLSEATDIPIRIIFLDLPELCILMESFGFDHGENLSFKFEKIIEENKRITIVVSEKIFDENMDLIPFESHDWNKQFVEKSEEEINSFDFKIDENDDLPF